MSWLCGRMVALAACVCGIMLITMTVFDYSTELTPLREYRGVQWQDTGQIQDEVVMIWLHATSTA